MAGRRSLIVSAGALLFGGCVSESSERTSSSSQPTQTDVRETSVDDTARGCQSGYYVSLTLFSPETDLPAKLDPGQTRLFDRLLAERTVSFTRYGSPPIASGTIVRSDTNYYRITFDRSDQTNVEARNANLSWEDGRSPPTSSDVISFGSLPPSDQRALRLMIDGPRYSLPDRPSNSLSISDFAAPYPAGTDESTLVGSGTVWISRDDRVYEVEVTAESSSITRRTYEYSTNQIAGSAQTFREYVSDRYLIVLDELSPEAASVLDATVEERPQRYEECNAPSSGITELNERLEDETTLPTRYNDRWYVEYEGNRYRLSITEFQV